MTTKMNDAMFAEVKQQFNQLLDDFKPVDANDDRLESIMESWWMMTTMWLIMNDCDYDLMLKDINCLYDKLKDV
jgi:hypothetical protein